MINDQGRPTVVQIRFGQDHNPVSWSTHWRTDGRGDIDTVMGLTGLTIENALTAVYPTDTTRRWPNKAA